jgi:hypothetical protein
MTKSCKILQFLFYVYFLPSWIRIRNDNRILNEDPDPSEQNQYGSWVLIRVSDPN